MYYLQLQVHDVNVCNCVWIFAVGRLGCLDWLIALEFCGWSRLAGWSWLAYRRSQGLYMII